MPPKRRSTLASLKDAQEQLRDAASGVQETLTQPDLQDLDAVADRSLQKNFSQKSFLLWDMSLEMAIDELRKLKSGEMLRDEDGSVLTDSKGRPITGSLFTSSDIFKCATMAKDATSLLVQILKNRGDEEDKQERRALLRMMVENETGRAVAVIETKGKKGG